MILGDNLGLHSILGFTESFNANFSCRFCLANKEQSRTMTSSDPTLLRTLEHYRECIATDDVHVTGLKEECIFNSLSYIHAVSNYSVDIMHDLFEGVCHYDMIHILDYLINSVSYFTTETLNNRIKYFDFEYEASNKPPNIKNDFRNKTKISMSASEMLCFVRYFSLLIGDLVPEGDEVWKFYLLLREILDLVTTDNVTNDVTNRLSNAITKHNMLYQSLFSDTLKPKHHLLVHYVMVMQKIGPLKNISSMRYESKHRQFKLSANVIASRRNVTKSLAIKHQLKLCYRLLNKLGFYDKIKINCSDIDIYAEDESTLCYQVVPKDFIIKSIVKWVAVGSTKIKLNSTILIDITDNMIPKFGVVEKILVSNSMQVGFLCKDLKTDIFQEHMHAFEVK